MKIKINERQQGNRIDKVLSEIYTNFTRSKIEKLIKNGCLLKNDSIFTSTSYKVKINDEFNLNIPEETENILNPTKIPLDVVFEDEDIIIINKQSGLTVHPGAGNNKYTLVNALLEKYGKENLSSINGEDRLGILHRLDKDTTGLMIVAKNNWSHNILVEQLKNKSLNREYIAFLWGVLSPMEGIIEGYIKNDKNVFFKREMNNIGIGKYSLTNYKTLKTFCDNSISMVNFQLSTGRTHQIRIHCSSMNCPLIGDKLYGGKSRQLKNKYVSIKEYVNNFPRQSLHSYKLSFIHPRSEKNMKFEIDLPNDMLELLNTLNMIF